MKLSVSWIFSHIDADWRKVDIEQLVDRFNRTTAEIEGFYKVDLDLKKLSLAEVTAVNSDSITVFSPEWKKESTLPFCDDAQVGQWYLIKKDAWVTLPDIHCPKEGFVPALHVDEKLRAGGWKKTFDFQDWIIEVDNKSITHRPDMWSHRGFAREIAAMLNLPFKPIGDFLSKKEIQAFDKKSPATDDCPIAISLKDQHVGTRFAGLYCGSVTNRASLLWMAYKLAIVGARPINLLVDVTNFAMLDVGHPLHAFDGKLFRTIEARLAKKGEKLTLLDDQEIELMPTDYVIADGKKPISLAGIMGGKESGVNEKTESIFLEAAHFDPTTIRRTASRLKLRSESSARFEKSLDPNQNIIALERCLKLLEDAGVVDNVAASIMSLGKPAQEISITVPHVFIEQRLGTTVDPEHVENFLKQIEFGVVRTGTGDKLVYQVTVPTFRSSKDVTIKEDIVEEIARFFGFENIPQNLPCLPLQSSDLSQVMRVRTIKTVLSRSLRMREVYNYALYDESFIQTLGFESENTVDIKNPVSEHWRRLVTSLIPHLLKDINQNPDHERLRFFEWARVWHLEKKNVCEHKSLAGVIFEKKSAIDFYEAKALLERLFQALAVNVQWNKAEKHVPFWCAPYQTAKLTFDEHVLGWAGMVNPVMLGTFTEGSAFAFELDGDALLAYKPAIAHYKPASKYPGVHRDVSMLVPLAVTVDDVVTAINSVDKRVHNVALIDFFQKDDWHDKKSLTFRFVIQDEQKTLTGQEADHVYLGIVKKLEKLGATIR